jgi:hypothetical protein
MHPPCDITRVLFTRARAALSAALCAACAVAGVACGPVKLSLQIQRGVTDAGVETDTSTIERLHIFFVDANGTKSDTEVKVDHKNQTQLDDIEVQKDTPFTIDVWGCTEPDACGRGDVVFRGCKAVDLSEQTNGDSVPIVVPMFDKDDEHVVACPPKLH